MHTSTGTTKGDDIASMTSFPLSLDAGWLPGHIINAHDCRCTLRTKG